MAITELGTHSVLYDLTTGKARQLPSARGYSPTLTDSVRVGFYSPVDAHTGVLFLNEPARRIVISPRGDLHRFHLAPRAHVVRLLVRLG